MNRRTVLVAGLVSMAAMGQPTAAQDRVVTIAYLDRDGDPFYAPSEGYGGIYGKVRESAVAGAQLAVKDAKILERALKTRFALVHRTLAEGQSIATVLNQLDEAERPAATIVDLPVEEVEAAARVASMPLFNIRHRETELRATTCKSRLFHTIPSEAMLQDSLAQHLRASNYSDVLIIDSEAPGDQAISKAFQASAEKFGLNIVDIRRFSHGNDPRQRELNNVRLLTGGFDYDAVFIADATREFARFVPYRTYLPRPVVGSVGLVPRAWHPLWERHGAPQLNRRFFRFANRLMSDEDWAAWVAVGAAIKAWTGAGPPLDQALLRQDL